VTENSRRLALRNAVVEWQQKHAIADDDPLMATVELWEAFLESAKMPDSTIAYHEIRQDLEQLNRLTKSLGKQSAEVIRELRAVPKIKDDLWAFPYFTVIVIAVAALIIGLLVGKFLL
jgi:ElaB/YqjD/DUF883 family membrane-anchored ribosome-binding protein